MIEDNHLQPMQNKIRRSSVYEKQLTEDEKMYRIISKNCNLALRPEIRQKKQQNDQIRIMGGIQDQKSIKQLWMLKTIKDNKKQIVNFWTDLVIENDNGDVKLEKGKQKATQKFQIQTVRPAYRKDNNEQREIRIKDTNNFYLTLDGTLEVNKLDQTDEAQIYHLKQIATHTFIQFQQTFMIIEVISKKCLDVARGELTIGSQVCIYDRNQRANQRWRFQPPFQPSDKDDTKYSIVNLLSGLRLWYDKNNGLIQTDNRQKIWQLKKKNEYQGVLYCAEKKKFLNKIKQSDRIVLQGKAQTYWRIC